MISNRNQFRFWLAASLCSAAVACSSDDPATGTGSAGTAGMAAAGSAGASIAGASQTAGASGQATAGAGGQGTAGTVNAGAGQGGSPAAGSGGNAGSVGGSANDGGAAGASGKPTGQVVNCFGNGCPHGECSPISAKKCNDVYPGPLTTATALCAPNASGQYCLGVEDNWIVTCSAGSAVSMKCDSSCAFDNTAQAALCF